MSENEHILAGPVQKTGDFTNGGRAVPGRSAVFSAAGRGDPSGNSNGVPLGKEGGLTEAEILKILGWPV